jgi:hypothetical protein
MTSLYTCVKLFHKKDKDKGYQLTQPAIFLGGWGAGEAQWAKMA